MQSKGQEVIKMVGCTHEALQEIESTKGGKFLICPLCNWSKDISTIDDNINQKMIVFTNSLYSSYPYRFAQFKAFYKAGYMQAMEDILSNREF